MKKFYLLLFLLSSLISQAQSGYEVKVENLSYRVVRNVKNSTSSNLEIKVIFSDNSAVTIHYEPIRDDYSKNNFNVGTFVFNKKPIRLHIGGFINFGSANDIDWDENIDLNNGCKGITHYEYFDNDGQLDPNLNFNYSSKPVVYLNQPVNDLIGFSDTFDVAVNQANSANFDSFVYHWQYQIVSNGVPTTNDWIDMPASVQGQSSFSIAPLSFLDPSVVDKRIYFRMKMCGDLVSQNVVSYVIRQSAPHIVTTITKDVNCYDTTDGSVKLNFDRPLLVSENEQLSLAIERDLNNSLVSPNWQLYVTTIPLTNIVLDGNNSFAIPDLPMGNYRIKMLGFYNGFNTYTDAPNQTTIFTINKPTPVAFTTSKVDVWCNGGDDGSVTLNAAGGVGGYQYQISSPDGVVGTWTNFTSANTTTISNLLPGTYKFKVQDSHSCIAKEQTLVNGEIQLGNEINLPIALTQPNAPVSITYNLVKDPTAFGFTNGKIVAEINGGTPFSTGNAYQYTWVDFNGNALSNTSVVAMVPFTIKADGLGDGTYKLTVTDSNFNSATNKIGCTIADSPITLIQPQPLKAFIELVKPISCHLDNEFGDNTDFDPLDGQRDEAQDGQLKAVVKGGKQFNGSANNGVPYKYTWKKQDASGVWQTLSNQTSVIAVALSNGNYAINVEDANGNVLGTSANNITTPVDVLYFFQQPDKLQLSFSVTDITCNSGTNGSVTANVTGGTPPYTYSWANGETTSTINNLASGNYFVLVQDARGCVVQGSKIVQQPGEIQVNVLTQKNPTCFGGSDGVVAVSVSGGISPYQISWNTGSTASQISNLNASTYTITVNDANNCTAVQNYILTNPPQYTINLGADRILCNEQSHHLDATISDPNATYQWTSTNGFTATSAQIEVTQAGTYHVKAASSLGCIAEDEVVIGKSTVGIDSRYIISNQAYSNEEIVLVNVSNPKAESTQWIFPPQTEIISQNDTYANIKLENVGEYDITLRSTQGACYQDYTHRIKVEKKGDLPEIGNTSNPFIKEFTLAPNPNNGNFTIIIDLADTSTVSLRIIDMAGAYVAQEKILNGQKIYTVDYTLSALTAGVYLIILETPKGTVVKRMIKF